MKVWSWQHAIQDSDVSPHTKLVLLNFSLSYNALGEAPLRDLEDQAKHCGLSIDEIHACYTEAANAGLIETKSVAKQRFVPQIPGNEDIEEKP